MQLILAHTAYCDTEQPHALLTELGFPRADRHKGGHNAAADTNLDELLSDGPDPAHATFGEPSDVAKLEKSVRATDRTHIVAFYTPPAHAIAEAITDPDITLQSAIQRWADSARTLLKVLRKNRKRVTLFDATAAAERPQACAAALAERLGISAPQAGLKISVEAASDSPEPLHRVIAHQAVAQSTELQDLHGELEASAQPLGADQLADPDCENALQELRARDRKQEEASQMSEENELLLLQLHQVQEELESYYLETQEKERQRSELASAKNKLNKRHEELKKEKEQVRKENRHLIKRRHELKKDLGKKEQEIARLARERDRARKQVEELKNSKSWRLTAPLRSIKGNGGAGKPSTGA